jgi:hypothetical protein
LIETSISETGLAQFAMFVVNAKLSILLFGIEANSRATKREIWGIVLRFSVRAKPLGSVTPAFDVDRFD